MSTPDPHNTPQSLVVTHLEGFPDPVRDPDTGMIVPQTRKERRALEAAQDKMRAKRQARQDRAAEHIDEPGDAGLDLGSDPASDPDPEDTTVLAVTEVEVDEAVPSTPVPVETVSEPVSRVGRNLPAAIIVGLLLLGVAAVGIFWSSLVLALLAVGLVTLGIWELAQVTKNKNIHLALTPAWVAGLAIPAAAWFGGVDAMVFALFGTILLTVFWTAVGEPDRPAASMATTLLAILWLPFFISFGVTLLHEPQGSLLLMTTLLAVVASDTFGYIIGATFGKHPMAPKVSPKKSWEGFFGSWLGASAVSVVLALFVLDYEWWVGIIIGTVLMLAATAGDFAASMVKRDFGVKVMCSTLPGHGGVMDRLDSIVFAVPVGYTLFVVVLPLILG